MRRSCGLPVFVMTAALTLGACGADVPEPSPDLPDRQAEAEVYETFQRAQDQCMTDKGFAATVHPDGARSFQGAGALEREELVSLLEECADQAGGFPESLPVLQVEKEKLYDLEVEAYECLVEQGHTPEPPVTREQFVATYGLGGSWSAHSRPGASHLPDDQCPMPKLADITW